MRETKTLWAEGDDAGSPALSRRSRVFLVAENGDRATALKAALAVAGCKIVGHAGAEEEFAQRLPNLSADIVVSYMPTPSRDTLATMSAVTRHYPVPIVMFVDSSDDATTEAAVRAQLDKAAELARKRGAAIVIGHPHKATVAALQAWIPTLEDVTLVPITALLNAPAPAPAVAETP